MHWGIEKINYKKMTSVKQPLYIYSIWYDVCVEIFEARNIRKYFISRDVIRFWKKVDSGDNSVI